MLSSSIRLWYLEPSAIDYKRRTRYRYGECHHWLICHRGGEQSDIGFQSLPFYEIRARARRYAAPTGRQHRRRSEKEEGHIALIKWQGRKTRWNTSPCHEETTLTFIDWFQEKCHYFSPFSKLSFSHGRMYMRRQCSYRHRQAAVRLKMNFIIFIYRVPIRRNLPQIPTWERSARSDLDC